MDYKDQILPSRNTVQAHNTSTEMVMIFFKGFEKTVIYDVGFTTHMSLH